MNAAQTMFSTNQVAISAPPSKNVDGKSKNEQKTNFSDTLSSAVSKSDKALALEKEQTNRPSSGEDTKQTNATVLPGLIANIIKKSGNSAKGQALLEPLAILSAEKVETDIADTAQLGQDSAVGINNAALVAQMLSAVPAAPLVPTVNTEVAVVTASAVGAPTAITVSQPQTTVLPEMPALPVNHPESLAASTDSSAVVTSQINQNLDLLPDVAQTDHTQLTLPIKAPDVAQTDQAQLTLPVKPSDVPVTSKPEHSEVPSAVATGITQPELPKMALMNQSKDAVIVADKNPTGAINEPEQQGIAPIIAITSQAKPSNQKFTDEGQKESFTDPALFSQVQAAQDLSANPNEELTSRTFGQGLELALMPKSDTLVGATVIDAQLQAKPSTDVHQIVDQIVEQSRMISKPQNTEMIIKLKPEHLGELTLKVVVENGTINASFHSNNAEVRNVIEASLPQLKQDLANNGLKVENVSVYAGLSQFSPNHDHDRSSRQQVIKFNNKKTAGDFVELIDTETEHRKISGIDGLSGVDYRI
ncbi:flagellar hook-length control protein FliK [Sporomusa sp.]|uniref:flagellar hook-length control protein FliK n=1 Tax=Sporomusa sp. TaxID=2078658 RepID=UPI002CBD5747|nr:flagellar hook-length control protein FliK [Sporomusa sp.]HWR43164.1 flagellar hook-length control protein FliK [Sporomusa sp.]